MEITWEPDVPKEYREAAGGYIQHYARMLPPYWRTLLVKFEADGGPNGDASACCHLSMPYRWVSLSLCPMFLRDTEAERERNIAHEMAHVLVAPLVTHHEQFANDIFDKLLTGQDTFRAFEDAAAVSAMEATVQDLAFMLVEFAGSEVSREAA